MALFYEVIFHSSLPMPHISYHASHEQFSPSQLLHYVQLAEKAGFTACHSSDHFHPWSKRQGQSGFSFAWLGAAMQVTQFPFSVITAPGQRYHPAIVAQAIATLAEMFPHRLEVALGSGEAINEAITGDEWPDKPLRNERLLECASIIGRLLNGEKVSHSGLVKVKEAQLYSRPFEVPPLFCAAITQETAEWAGTWADGLLTVHQPPEQLRKTMALFRGAGGEDKPIHAQMAFSYARSKDDALEGAYQQWRSNLVGMEDLANLATVEQFDAKGEQVTKEEFASKFLVITRPEDLIEPIQQCLALGIENMILHNVHPDQASFIEDFGKTVLPQVLNTDYTFSAT